MSRIPQQRRASDHPCEAGGVRFTTELELLWACCVALRADCQEKLKYLLTRRYDFAAFMTLAREHRVIPQVYRSISVHSELLDGADLATLRSAYEENARRALCLTGELLRVLRHFQRHGIDVLPYKGPVLAQRLYGDVTARQFFDLDILVSPQDVGAAKAALAQLGYVPEIKLSAREQTSFIASGYEYAFSGAAGHHTLELKWRILPRFYSVEFDTEAFSARAKNLVIGTYSVPTLCDDDLLLVLCVHAAKHMWSQLSWWCDIAEITRSRQIQWETICSKAEQLGIGRIVAVSLLLVHDLLQSDLPISVQEWCRKDSEIGILSEQISGMISEGSSYDTGSSSYFTFMLRLRERSWDKLRFLRRLVWTPSIGEWSVTRLPPELSFAYHFVRMGRLACRIFSPHLRRGRAPQTRSGWPILWRSSRMGRE